MTQKNPSFFYMFHQSNNDLKEQIPKLQEPSASFPYSPSSSTHKAPIVAATTIMLVDDEPVYYSHTKQSYVIQAIM
jgi:hypothetical protein